MWTGGWLLQCVAVPRTAMESAAIIVFCVVVFFCSFVVVALGFLFSCFCFVFDFSFLFAGRSLEVSVFLACMPAGLCAKLARVPLALKGPSAGHGRRTTDWKAGSWG